MEEAKKRRILFNIYDWVRFFALTLAVCVFIIAFIRPSFVVGSSMMNTLHEGDFVLMEKFSYIFREPTKGDVVIVKSKNELGKILVKRVIAEAGDHIEILDGKVYLNDQLLNESYIKDGITNGNLDVIVPEGNFFIMGDNRLHSNDSRGTVGLVERKEIMGRLYFRLYPFSSIGGIK